MNPNRVIPKGTPVYGVDVGNGFGKISLLRMMNEEPIFLLPESLRAGMPSTAYISPADGSIQVYGAKSKAASRAIRAVKTLLNEEYIELKDKSKTYRVKPAEVYASIARDLVRLANQERAKRGEKPVYLLILTYPASFRNSTQMLALLKQSVEAVELDGHKLQVCGMISEPAAVAVDYHYFARYLAEVPSQAPKYTVLVYDLGHGTFDAAVVTAYTNSDKDCDVFRQDGNPEVGGRKLDELLYNALTAQIRRQAGENATFNRESLRNLAVEIKHELSQRTVVERDFPVGDDEILLRITREEFEILIAPQINLTLEVVQSLLEEAKNEGITVDAIILSGGGGKIPMIRQALVELTDNTIPVTVYRPSEGVSFGASRYAHDLYREEDTRSVPAPMLTQHCERSSGVAVGDTVTMLLNEDAQLPCQSEPFSFVSAASGRSKFVLYYAKNRVKDAQVLAREDAQHLCNLYLNIPPRQSCQLVMRMDVNRFVSIECTLPDGKVIEVSAACHKED